MARIRSQVGDELARLLCESIGAACGVEVERRSSRDWASITFSGQRHDLRLRLEGEGAAAAADAWLEGLEERDFALRGHILADIALVSDARADDGRSVRLGLEALTVEAA